MEFIIGILGGLLLWIAVDIGRSKDRDSRLDITQLNYWIIMALLAAGVLILSEAESIAIWINSGWC